MIPASLHHLCTGHLVNRGHLALCLEGLMYRLRVHLEYQVRLAPDLEISGLSEHSILLTPPSVSSFSHFCCLEYLANALSSFSAPRFDCPIDGAQSANYYLQSCSNLAHLHSSNSRRISKYLPVDPNITRPSTTNNGERVQLNCSLQRLKLRQDS